MKYEFSKHVGFENFNAEGGKNMFCRMCEVLDMTGVEVNFHIRPKSWRKEHWHFLAPIGMIRCENGVAKWYEIHGLTRIERGLVLPSQFSKHKMVQIIKKALKNYTRKNSLASLKLSATL
jgi:hypothetical protein